MIFAIPITWDFLDEIDKKILAYFVRACKILTSRELQKRELSEAFTKLDYDPLSSFWCFDFERMNGILGTLIINFSVK